MPPVSFDINKSINAGGFVRHKIDILAEAAEDTKIGDCDLIISDTRAHFDGIRLTMYWRGKGLGMAAYLLAIETSSQQGVPFETQDVHQSESAKRIWLSLAEVGLAEEVEPFRPLNKEAHGQQLYAGKYRVPIL